MERNSRFTRNRSASPRAPSPTNDLIKIFDPGNKKANIQQEVAKRYEEEITRSVNEHLGSEAFRKEVDRRIAQEKQRLAAEVRGDFEAKLQEMSSRRKHLKAEQAEQRMPRAQSECVPRDRNNTHPFGNETGKPQPDCKCGSADQDPAAESMLQELLRQCSGSQSASGSSDDVENRSSGKTVTDAPDSVSTWTVRRWLESLSCKSAGPPTSIVDMIAHALTRDLAEERQLDFVKALGGKATPDMIRQLLTTGRVVGRLTDVILSGARELGDVGGRALTSKFLHDSRTSELEACGSPEGLQHLVGATREKMLEAMWREHCEQADSDLEWKTHDYAISTTPRKEWAFVVDPEGGPSRAASKESLLNAVQGLSGGQDSFASEVHQCLSYEEFKKSYQSRHKEFRGLTAAQRSSLSTVWSAPTEEHIRPEHRRVPRRLADFRVELVQLNQLLETAREQPLLPEELIAARLYTGPMFERYNTALHHITNLEGIDAEFQERCRGNRYAATLLSISSAVAKLSRILPRTLVFRGVRGPSSPGGPRNPSIDCGSDLVEHGFVSTTTDKVAAMACAAANHVGLVLELEAGVSGHGADLAWASEYPHEAEVCFGPLTCFKVLRTHWKFPVLVAQVEPTAKPEAALGDGLSMRRKAVVESLVTVLRREIILSYKAADAVLQRAGILQDSLTEATITKLTELTERAMHEFSDNRKLLGVFQEALALRSRWIRDEMLSVLRDEAAIFQLLCASRAQNFEKALANLQEDIDKNTYIMLLCMSVRSNCSNTYTLKALRVLQGHAQMRSMYSQEWITQNPNKFPTILDFKRSGWTVEDVKAVGLSVEAMHHCLGQQALATAEALKREGFSPMDVKALGYSSQDVQGAWGAVDNLKSAGFTPQQAQEAGYSIDELRRAWGTAADLKKAGFSPMQLKELGFSMAELAVIWRVAEIHKEGHSLHDLGCSAIEQSSWEKFDLKKDELSHRPEQLGSMIAVHLVDAGFSMHNFIDIGFKAVDLRQAGYDPHQLHKLGYSAADLRSAGCSPAEVKGLGCSISDLRRAWPVGDLKQGGFSVQDARTLGYSPEDLVLSGLTAKCRGAGGSWQLGEDVVLCDQSTGNCYFARVVRLSGQVVALSLDGARVSSLTGEGRTAHQRPVKVYALAWDPFT